MFLGTIGCLSLVFVVLQGSDPPRPPRFILPPSVRTTAEPIRLLIWSEPHPNRRTVIAEAWIVESETDDGKAIDIALTRSSSVQADDDRKLFSFEWHPLEEGSYLLYARVLGARGLTYRSPPHRLEVR